MDVQERRAGLGSCARIHLSDTDFARQFEKRVCGIRCCEVHASQFGAKVCQQHQHGQNCPWACGTAEWRAQMKMLWQCRDLKLVRPQAVWCTVVGGHACWRCRPAVGHPCATDPQRIFARKKGRAAQQSGTCSPQLAQAKWSSFSGRGPASTPLGRGDAVHRVWCTATLTAHNTAAKHMFRFNNVAKLTAPRPASIAWFLTTATACQSVWKISEHPASVTHAVIVHAATIGRSFTG